MRQLAWLCWLAGGRRGHQGQAWSIIMLACPDTVKLAPFVPHVNILHAFPQTQMAKRWFCCHQQHVGVNDVFWITQELGF